MMRKGLAAFSGAVHKLSDRINFLAEAALCLLGSGMALLIAVQVFSRYVLNHSLFWSEELERICLVWITFLGGSAAFKRHGHIGVDFFVKRLPQRVQALIELLVLMLCLFFFGILIKFGFDFASFVSAQRTTALGISLAIPYAVIPLGGALFFLHALDRLLRIFSPVTGDV